MSYPEASPPVEGDPPERHHWIGRSRGIGVRHLVIADVPALVRWMQPDQEWHAWDGPYFAKLTPAQVEAWADRLHQTLADGSYVASPPVPRAAIVAEDAPERVLGTVSWHWESQESGWRRVGLTVYDPDVRGRGVGTEALRVWTDYMFATTDAVRLDFSTWSGNARMLGVGARLGWTEEARFRDAREVRGERYDSVVMGVLRREWVAQPGHGSSDDGQRVRPSAAGRAPVMGQATQTPVPGRGSSGGSRPTMP